MMTFPPTCAGCVLVLRMYRMGFEGATDAVIPSNDGLEYPYAYRYPPQLGPTHGVKGLGRAMTSLANCFTVANILFALSAVPLSTNMMPSRPSETTTLAAGSGMSQTLPCTGYALNRLPGFAATCCWAPIVTCEPAVAAIPINAIGINV